MMALASSTFGGAKAPLPSLISLALGFLASSCSGLNRNFNELSLSAKLFFTPIVFNGWLKAQPYG